MLGLPAAQIQGQTRRARCSARPSTRRSPRSSSAWGARREGMVDREVHLRRDGQAVALLASATALRGPDGAYMGMVLAFDDLTELLKAQRLAAWREVAQRIAHEIKNPLTPIQLSAQRLRRRLSGDRSPEEKRLLEEATATIIQEVDGLKQLVDEFSRFARMPVAHAPSRRTSARLLEGVVVLYRESHPALSIRAAFSPDLPRSRSIPTRSSAPSSTWWTTRWRRWAAPARSRVRDRLAARDADRARIVVSDDGPGIAAEDKERLFVPYFSTKATGMGLGLPIVHQIVDRPRRHHLGGGQPAARQPLRDRAARASACPRPRRRRAPDACRASTS